MFNPDFFFHDFAFIVLDLRKKYDISQEYCAELACIHRNTIARMESGRTESRTSALLRLYGFFGIWRVSRAPAGPCTVYGVTAHCIDSGRDYDIYLK